MTSDTHHFVAYNFSIFNIKKLGHYFLTLTAVIGMGHIYLLLSLTLSPKLTLVFLYLVEISRCSIGLKGLKVIQTLNAW